jgi:hypothetical protein
MIEQGALMYFLYELSVFNVKGMYRLKARDSHNEHSSAIDRPGPTSLHNPNFRGIPCRVPIPREQLNNSETP